MDWFILAMEAAPDMVPAPTGGAVSTELFVWIISGMAAAIIGLCGWIVLQSKGRTTDQKEYAAGITDREKAFQSDWAAREKEMQAVIEGKNRELMQIVKDMMASHSQDALRDQAVAEALKELKGVLQQQQQLLFQGRFPVPAPQPYPPSGAYPVVPPTQPPGGTGDGT